MSFSAASNSRPNSAMPGYSRRQGGSYIRTPPPFSGPRPQRTQSAHAGQSMRHHSANTPSEYFHYSATTRPDSMYAKRGPSFEPQMAPAEPVRAHKPWASGINDMGWTRPRPSQSAWDPWVRAMCRSSMGFPNSAVQTDVEELTARRWLGRTRWQIDDGSRSRDLRSVPRQKFCQ